VWCGVTEYCWNLVVERVWRYVNTGSFFDVHLIIKIFT
jgi:hypothetical protein